MAGSRVPQGPSRVLHQRSYCCSQHLILQQQSADLPAFPPPPWMHFDGGRKFLMVWPYAVCLCVCTHTHTQGPPSHCNTQAHNTHTQLYAHTHIGPPHHTCTRIHTQLYTHTHTRPPHHTCTCIHTQLYTHTQDPHTTHAVHRHTHAYLGPPHHTRTHIQLYTHTTHAHTRVCSLLPHTQGLSHVGFLPRPLLSLSFLISHLLHLSLQKPLHTHVRYSARD